MAAPSTTVRLLALLLSVYLVSFLPKGSATSECPGYELTTYPIAGTSWPGSGSTASPLGVGMYYEEANDLIWSLYNGPFGLAAWTPSELISGGSWTAAYLDVGSTRWASGTQLAVAQNLIVDSTRGSIIVTTNDVSNTLYWLNRADFIAGGTLGATSSITSTKSLALGDTCRGIAFDPANDGSFWVACLTAVHKYSSAAVVLGSYSLTTLMPANSYLWELTTDNVHGKLWGSSDNTNINFYQFDIIGNSLVFNTTLNVGDESRGIVYDPTFEELYAVRRTGLTEGNIVVRTKAYLQGFAFAEFNSSSSPLTRSNGMVYVPAIETIFVVTTPALGLPQTSNGIHMFAYQHAGCQCINDIDCDGNETCHIGICVTASCTACQVGTKTGGCAGSGTCVSSNATSFATELQFAGPSPHHRLLPVLSPSYYLDVLFEEIDEIPPQGGLPAQVQVLLSQQFIIEQFTDTFTDQNFLVSATTGFGYLSFTFSLLGNNGANRTFGAVPFDQQLNSNKWTLQMGSWPWLNGTSLILRVRLLSNDGAFLTATSANTSTDIITWTLTTAHTTIKVSLFTFALVDGHTKAPVTSSFYVGDTVLLIQLPYFAHNLTYDPDFAVILEGVGSTSGTVGDGGDGSGSSSLVPLAALAALVIVPVVLVVTGIGVIAFIWLRNRKKAVSSMESVNFGQDDGEL